MQVIDEYCTNTVFRNAKIALSLRHVVMEMNHPQPLTRIIIDNSTATGYMNDNIIQGKNRKVGIWISIGCGIRGKGFEVVWKKRAVNRAHSFTKRLPTVHCRSMRPTRVRNNLYIVNNVEHRGTARVCR